MENHKIQNQFDENAEWDQILADLNLTPRLSKSTSTSTEAEAAERGLIEETEDWNSILASLEIEAQNFEAYAKRETAQRSLLDQQRKIILENQKRVEEEMRMKEIEIEQVLAKEEYWRAEREPVNVEQNRRRALETEIMLQLFDDVCQMAFYSQEEELNALGAKASKASRTTAEDSDSEEGGVLRTVVTKCEIPDCEQCKAARANIKLEEPDGSVHFDGTAIVPVITDCRIPANLQLKNRDAHTAPGAPLPHPLIKAKDKSKKSKTSRLVIDWSISPGSPASSQQGGGASLFRGRERDNSRAAFGACDAGGDDFGDDDFMGNNL